MFVKSVAAVVRGCGGIGRRTRFRFWRATVQVQVLSPAGKKALVFHVIWKVDAFFITNNQGVYFA